MDELMSREEVRHLASRLGRNISGSVVFGDSILAVLAELDAAEKERAAALSDISEFKHHALVCEKHPAAIARRELQSRLDGLVDEIVRIATYGTSDELYAYIRELAARKERG